MRKLVLASNNPGKLREIGALLAPLEIEVTSQAALGVDEADEPHATFLENALAKARHASLATGLPALADDSGLCVDALGGAPGVQSAYYAGSEGSREERDARNNAKLVAALAGVGDRRAHYYCVMVLVRHADDPQPIFAEGVWRGEISSDAARRGRLRLRPAVLSSRASLHLGRAGRARKEPHQPSRAGAGEADCAAA